MSRLSGLFYSRKKENTLCTETPDFFLGKFVVESSGLKFDDFHEGRVWSIWESKVAVPIGIGAGLQSRLCKESSAVESSRFT